jgi:hypothetical protein
MKRDDEKNHVIVKNIETLKSITKEIKSKVLVSQTAQQLGKVRKSLDSKLKAFGYQTQDFDNLDQDIPVPQHQHER